MRKRLIAILSLALMLCSIFAVPALASGADLDVPSDPVDPEEPYVDISYYNCGCTISSTGLATCSSYAQTRNTTYSIYISIALQQYANGSWHYYAGNWSNSGTGYCGSYAYWYVASGYYYRTVSTVTVRTASGSYVESQTLYSPTKYY